MVCTRKRPIEPTLGILQDVWISLTLLLESRSMSQARLPGFLPACLPCHGAVIPGNLLPVPAPARGSPGSSRESYKDCLFLGLGLGGVQWCRRTAILGSLMLEGLPHILPESERNLTALHVQELESPWRNQGKKTESLTREFPREQNSKFPFWSSSSVNVHMLPHVYKLYKCLHDTIKLCSLPSLYLYYKVLFQKKKKTKKSKVPCSKD